MPCKDRDQYLTTVLREGSLLFKYLFVERLRLRKAAVHIPKSFVVVNIVQKEIGERVRIGKRDFIQMHVSDR